MEKVVVNRGIIGIYTMQVCAHKEATDEEIISVANKKNPAGTEGGWRRVCRKSEEHPDHPAHEGKTLGPVQCADDQNREHILLVC